MVPEPVGLAKAILAPELKLALLGPVGSQRAILSFSREKVHDEPSCDTSAPALRKLNGTLDNHRTSPQTLSRQIEFYLSISSDRWVASLHGGTIEQPPATNQHGHRPNARS